MAGKDRGASRYEPIGASTNGVEILGARDLTPDMLLLRLAVPSHTNELEPTKNYSPRAPSTDTTSPAPNSSACSAAYTRLPEHHERCNANSKPVRRP